jgi:hypothetical protein
VRRESRVRKQSGAADNLVAALEATGDPLARKKAGKIRDCTKVERKLRCRDCGKPFFVRGLPCLARLCPRCDQARACKFRERLDRLVKGRKGLRHVILTLRGDPRAALADSITRILEAFEELRRRAAWKHAKVLAGVRSLEITRGSENAGWHVHLHVLIDSGWLDHPALKAAWLAITGDSSVVYVKRKDGASAVSEIVKYVTKPADMKALDQGELTELVHALHGRRLIAFFGAWFKRENEERALEAEILEDAREQWEKVAKLECPACGGQLVEEMESGP